MNEHILNELINIERQYTGPLSSYCIQFNSEEYYAPFVRLYRQDRSTFLNTLTALLEKDALCSVKADCLSYFLPERLEIHLWRLSVFFGLDNTPLPQRLKDLCLLALDLQRSDDLATIEKGKRLYAASIEFLKSLHVKPTSAEAQLYFENASPALPSFDGITSLDQVDDVLSAIFYFDCYECRLVKKPPAYLEQALRAAALYNHLFSSVLWNHYLYNLTESRKTKDQQLLRCVGFVMIPDLLSTIDQEMNAQLMRSDFFYTGKKLEICQRLCLKYKMQIEESMNAEKNTVNDFIRSNGKG